jgi:hypothetical protein
VSRKLGFSPATFLLVHHERDSPVEMQRAAWRRQALGTVT